MINTITIDTETMDVQESAVILSIAGFAFDIEEVDGVQDSIMEVVRNPELADYSKSAFYGLVDTFGQLMQGRTVSAETQQWWIKQEEDAHEALAENPEPLSQTLVNLTSWIQQPPGVRIFFRGTDFDGSILESVYRYCGLTCPWHFAGKRDVPTYIDAMVKGTKGYLPKTHQPCFATVKHHSLHDAMNDAEQMTIAYRLNSRQVGA